MAEGFKYDLAKIPETEIIIANVAPLRSKGKSGHDMVRVDITNSNYSGLLGLYAMRRSHYESIFPDQPLESGKQVRGAAAGLLKLIAHLNPARAAKITKVEITFPTIDSDESGGINIDDVLGSDDDAPKL